MMILSLELTIFLVNFNNSLAEVCIFDGKLLGDGFASNLGWEAVIWPKRKYK